MNELHLSGHTVEFDLEEKVVIIAEYNQYHESLRRSRVTYRSNFTNYENHYLVIGMEGPKPRTYSWIPPTRLQKYCTKRERGLCHILKHKQCICDQLCITQKQLYQLLAYKSPILPEPSGKQMCEELVQEQQNPVASATDTWARIYYADLVLANRYT
jgi:hypothetical protein